ncbi:disease resistance protein TAO1 [Prunus persica]|uniref:disease resistance protein TAO1 n=1 Tax=Prunus persica TaxID=3760 RepID=UPI0009AB83CD|nr:disease resistance protein TAO1 [Prunus persica]
MRPRHIGIFRNSLIGARRSWAPRALLTKYRQLDTTVDRGGSDRSNISETCEDCDLACEDCSSDRKGISETCEDCGPAYEDGIDGQTPPNFRQKSYSNFIEVWNQSESKFIQNIIEEISKYVLNCVPLEVAEHPVGMQPQIQVMNKLLDLRENDVRMIGVRGTGQIGKTTIGKAVYNSIARKFEGCSSLANVRERSTSHEGSIRLRENLLSDILRAVELDDGVNLIHEVKILDDDKALELFCWHAFKTSEPPLGDYMKLAELAIRYAQGLPLALKVLGSCLCGGSIDKWEAALDGFKSKKIQDVLKISYNALDDIVKEVFLDIACFFKGKSRNYVIETLEACDLSPRYGIEVLIEKALISVEHRDYIRMHDLLEEMGKDIVEQESPTEAEGRSRLWFHKDIEHVLTENTHFKNLACLNFTGSQFLTEIPDLSSSPNLRYLKANRCTSLVNVHPSVGHLDKLEILDFYDCHKLTKFPRKVASKSLIIFRLNGCIKLESFPKIVNKMESLCFLDLERTAIKKLPKSIGHLIGLQEMRLSESAIKELPALVGDLIGLKKLVLFGSAIKELPSSIGNLTALEVLQLGGSAIEELPSSIRNLTALQRLNLEGCENLANLPPEPVLSSQRPRAKI